MIVTLSRHDYPINLRMHDKLQRLDALSKGLSGIIQLLNDRVISNDWQRANGDQCTNHKWNANGSVISVVGVIEHLIS